MEKQTMFGFRKQEGNAEFNTRYGARADLRTLTLVHRLRTESAIARRLRSATKQAANSYCAGAPQPPWRLRRLREIVADLRLGVKCLRAAVRDEKNALPFTSAMEWRKAAELFSISPQVSDRCWQEWERIMHLPRRFARPIGESAEASRHCLLFYDNHKIAKAVAKETPAAIAA